MANNVHQMELSLTVLYRIKLGLLVALFLKEVSSFHKFRKNTLLMINCQDSKGAFLTNNQVYQLKVLRSIKYL